MSSMVSKLWLVALVLALVVAAESSLDDNQWGFSRLASGDGDLPALRCKGRMGDCIYNLEDEEMLDSESSRRQLAARRGRFISYDALKKNNVPCNQRGASYYNCNKNNRVNPYNRGCTYITRCARYLE